MDEKWDHYGKHILLEMERLDLTTHKISEDVNDIKIEFAKMSARSHLIWGMLGGSIPSIVAIAIAIYFK